MAITAKNEGTTQDFKICPSGMHVARCYQMVDLGTHTEEFQGQMKRQRKVRINFELPNELAVFKPENGEQPYSLGQDFTLSMHEKATLRKTLESWRGKPFTEDEAKAFDITKLLGQPCMINVVHGTSQAGKQYAKIASITPLMKGITCPAQVNASFEFSLENFDAEKFRVLPKWLQEKIEKSEEFGKIANNYHAAEHEAKTASDESEDLPF